MSRRRKRSEEDDDLDDDDDDDEEQEIAASSKKRKKKKGAFLDDAAVESGEEDNEDEDDEEEEDNNEYVKDGFLVDEDEVDEEVTKSKSKDDLEDSDDDDDDDDDEEEDRGKKEMVRKKSRLTKLKQTERLAEEDLELIREAQGLGPSTAGADHAVADALEDRPVQHIRARNEAELQKTLFDGGDEEEEEPSSKQSAKQQQQRRRPPASALDRYDEDGMDDFIEDDLHDQDDIRASEQRGMMDDDGYMGNEVSEAQLSLASEIFGTDYLDFMNRDAGGRDDEEEDLMGRRRERGIDFGYDDAEDSDEGSLFGGEEEDDDDDINLDGLTEQQKAEALKLKREKTKLAKQERRRKAQQAKTEKRKAQLRRVFEPVQLIENFCTERDDLIRQTDVPERLFGWGEGEGGVTFYGPAEYKGKGESDVDSIPLTDMERKQAEWIAKRVPSVAEAFHATGGVTPMDLGGAENGTPLAPHQEEIVTSISYTLRYIHRDKFELAFIKRYRKDYITSTAVRENLHQVVEEDTEWDRMIKARAKVQELLSSITGQADGDAQASMDSDGLVELRQKLDEAKQALDDSQARASTLQTELDALSKKKGDDDDDDQLFDDDDEEEEDEAEKAKEKARVNSSLKDVKQLVTLHTERATQFQSQLDLAEAQNRALNEKGPQMERVMMKMRRESLWNDKDYREEFLSKVEEAKEVVDMNGYLHLIQEGNEAIKKKEMPILAATGGKESRHRRSRRFDRDYYRTCVAEGLRAVCYKFLLSPNRVGVKLEDQFQNNQGTAFDFTRTMPGEEDKHDPLQWVPPQISKSPTDFCNELIGSGELVLLSNSGNSATSSSDEDPLRGCRFVAALELASEPRVRKYMRQLFRQYALLTTKPTAKGLEELDAFHDYYGLHLIRNKPTQDHFPAILTDTPDQIRQRNLMSPIERNEMDTNRKQRQIDSCLQYLNIIKAAQAGFLTSHIHLPMASDISSGLDDWYHPDNKAFSSNRAAFQSLDILAQPLERVYMPPDGDTDAWNNERKQVVRMALTNFLLPALEAELRRDLMEVASRVGVQAAASNLREMAMEGPYRPDRQQPPGLYYNESRFVVPTGDLSVVGYCCSPEGSKDASYFAHVSQHGKAEDFLAVPSGTRIETGKMRDKVILFLIKARPAVVVVGTSGGFESRMVYRRLSDLINEAKQRWSNRFIQGDDEDDEAFRTRQDDLAALSVHNDFDDDVEWKCDVELIDDKVAQLFGRSVRSKKEFPDFPMNHKTAIATARYAKDPLAELTYTWSVASDAGVFGTEMLYFNVHPLQQLLPRSLLLREYERVLCDVTADVGSDVNATCAHDHLCGLLMFTPGLGPRKAANLKQMVADRNGVVARRRDLLEDRLMGPVVYNNSVAFLRIQQTDQLIDQHLHPLDSTRLHPAIYVQHDWAVKISFDALERENIKIKAIKALTDAMTNSQQEVARLLEATQAEWERNFQSPFRFKEWDPRVNVPAEHWSDEIGNLDLDAFAKAIEGKGHGRWNSHFEMLLWEFRLPFFDPRKPMEPLEGEKLFRLITGESDQSLRPGKEVTGKVVSNGEFGSRVKLEGDIPAFIPLRLLSDDHVEAPEDIVAPGQVVTAIVTEVKKDHMTVDMSLRMEDFRKNPSSWERPLSLAAFDQYFDLATASRIEEDNNKKREAHLEALQIALNRNSASGDGVAETKRKKRVARRACTHPAFRNARQDEVDRELREAGAGMVGQALIRPSTKQSDSLAVHWVVKEGCIKVIEVLEEDKETDAAIGNILKIKDETYGSIDELLGRYIEPLNDLVDELQNHRKFMTLAEDDVDDKLRAEKKKNPSGIPYALCWMDVNPGYASLRFIINANPYSHPIGITPKGFTFSSKVFMTLDQLVNDFKRNPRGSRTSSSSNDASRATKPSAPVSVAPPRPPPPKPNRWGDKSNAAGTTTATSVAETVSQWQQQQQQPPPPPPRPPVPAAASGWAARPAPPATTPGASSGWAARPAPPAASVPAASSSGWSARPAPPSSTGTSVPAASPGWGARPAPPSASSGWGARPAPGGPAGWSSTNQQQQQPAPPPPRPPPPRPPVQDLPPPPAYVPPPNAPRPMIPPQPNAGPPPPMAPPPQQQQQQRPPAPPPPGPGYGQPPPPPSRPAGPPPAFASTGASQPSVGRGRGRTLPAWMAKQQSEA